MPRKVSFDCKKAKGGKTYILSGQHYGETWCKEVSAKKKLHFESIAIRQMAKATKRRAERLGRKQLEKNHLWEAKLAAKAMRAQIEEGELSGESDSDSEWESDSESAAPAPKRRRRDERELEKVLHKIATQVKTVAKEETAGRRSLGKDMQAELLSIWKEARVDRAEMAEREELDSRSVVATEEINDFCDMMALHDERMIELKKKQEEDEELDIEDDGDAPMNANADVPGGAVLPAPPVEGKTREQLNAELTDYAGRSPQKKARKERSDKGQPRGGKGMKEPEPAKF